MKGYTLQEPRNCRAKRDSSRLSIHEGQIYVAGARSRRKGGGASPRETQRDNTIYLIRHSVQVPAKSIIVLRYGWRKRTAVARPRDLRQLGSSQRQLDSADSGTRDRSVNPEIDRETPRARVILPRENRPVYHKRPFSARHCSSLSSAGERHNRDWCEPLDHEKN